MASNDTGFSIREYDPHRDEKGARACIVALQDHEHEFSPESPTGMELVDDLMPFMLKRIPELKGKLMVAESAGRIIGFVCVVIRPREEPDDTDPFYVELTELSVLPGARNSGVGGRLMEVSEEFARSAGAPSLRIRVDARNSGARRFYDRLGFEESLILVMKRLMD